MNANARIYVACLASYNNGVHHGAWIDVDNADDIRDAIAELLRASRFPNVTVTCPACSGIPVGKLSFATVAPCERCGGALVVPSAEEWAIHDYELPHGHMLGSTTPDLGELCELVELLEEHGEPFAKWLACGYAEDADAFRDAYIGVYKNVIDWAETWLDEIGHFENVPEHITRYFDFEAYANDAERGGDIWTAEGDEGLHVFHNN